MSDCRHWLERYMEEYGHFPDSAAQLCAFARNNDGRIMYREAGEFMLTLKENMDTVGNEDISMALFPPEPTELQRIRSDQSTKPRLQRTATVEPVVAEKPEEGGELARFGLGFDAVVLEEYVGKFSTVEACSICLEKKPCRLPAGKFCAERRCNGLVCASCLEEHLTLTVTDSRFAVPFVRCPGCMAFLPSDIWKRDVPNEVFDNWRSNARHLLSLRCGECDEPSSLLQPGVEDEDGTALQAQGRAQNAEIAFQGLDPAELLKAWNRFQTADIEADSLLELLCLEDSDTEALSAEVQARLSACLSLIEDVGRRAVLQLAALRRWPKIETRCCQAKHCFRCQVGSHHDGVSCEQVQRRQMPEDLQDSEAVQFCPSCSVATMKTEGCNHIICLCGESWTWSGAEIWAEEWLHENDG